MRACWKDRHPSLYLTGGRNCPQYKCIYKDLSAYRSLSRLGGDGVKREVAAVAGLGDILSKKLQHRQARSLAEPPPSLWPVTGPRRPIGERLQIHPAEDDGSRGEIDRRSQPSLSEAEHSLESGRVLCMHLDRNWKRSARRRMFGFVRPPFPREQFNIRNKGMRKRAQTLGRRRRRSPSVVREKDSGSVSKAPPRASGVSRSERQHLCNAYFSSSPISRTPHQPGNAFVMGLFSAHAPSAFHRPQRPGALGQHPSSALLGNGLAANRRCTGRLLSVGYKRRITPGALSMSHLPPGPFSFASQQQSSWKRTRTIAAATDGRKSTRFAAKGRLFPVAPISTCGNDADSEKDRCASLGPGCAANLSFRKRTRRREKNKPVPEIGSIFKYSAAPCFAESVSPLSVVATASSTAI